ncbi:hypothetical protein GCM10011583_48210 [Streptomyces camponoticapitis]|uniref:MFS transporter n=1 Tax=Streptomyces camponoticapitis TaxID=1616125 RepID=A0ABQ2EIQ3_9ACTN|nr:hypothetical protein [Streptomyces camponoticapitis]GGK10442.1 hypothetical protein GCM10011583_48210 [Streptomyces camponoticapitis]
MLTVTPLGGLVAGYFVDSAGLFAATWVLGGAYLVVTLAPAIFPVWRLMDQPAPAAGAARDAGRPRAGGQRAVEDGGPADPDTP